MVNSNNHVSQCSFGVINALSAPLFDQLCPVVLRYISMPMQFPLVVSQSCVRASLAGSHRWTTCSRACRAAGRCTARCRVAARLDTGDSRRARRTRPRSRALHEAAAAGAVSRDARSAAASGTAAGWRCPARRLGTYTCVSNNNII